MNTKFLAATLLFSALSSSFSLQAFAEPVSCIENHETQAASKFNETLETLLAKALAKKGIALDGSQSHIAIEASPFTEYEDAYGTFSFTENSKLVTASGTKFNLAMKAENSSGEGLSYSDATTAFYKAELKGKGFDREGNAINGHCNLTFAITGNWDTDNPAGAVEITNAKTGRLILRVDLPTQVLVY